MRTALLLTLSFIIACGAPEPAPEPPAQAEAAPEGFERWEEAMQAFDKENAENSPEKGQIVFTGSSSARLWPLDKSFPDLDVLNRGFGGSEISDTIHFAERFLFPLEPRIIVFYAGDNDIGHGESPESVAEDYQTFAAMVHEALPGTRIAYIAIKPSIRRWNLIEQVREANNLIQAQTEADDLADFVDIAAPMIGDNGEPRPELFVEDGLHLTAEGYELWTSILRPYLDGDN